LKTSCGMQSCSSYTIVRLEIDETTIECTDLREKTPLKCDLRVPRIDEGTIIETVSIYDHNNLRTRMLSHKLLDLLDRIVR
jgi:hypothetical protein